MHRRRVPVRRLPDGSGGFDAADAVAAYLRASETLDKAAPTYLASASGRSAAGEGVPDSHAAGVSGARNAASGRHHAPARPHVSPISEEAASAISNALADPRIQAFLRLISFEEFGRERDENYRTRYGDLKGHDPITDQDMLHCELKNMGSGSNPATPGGAYQIVKKTYEEAVKKKIVSDFLPASQGRIAAYLLYKLDALQSIEDNNLHRAFKILYNTWSSLPGGVSVKENLKDAEYRYNRYLTEEDKMVIGEN